MCQSCAKSIECSTTLINCEESYLCVPANSALLDTRKKNTEKYGIISAGLFVITKLNYPDVLEHNPLLPAMSSL